MFDLLRAHANQITPPPISDAAMKRRRIVDNGWSEVDDANRKPVVYASTAKCSMCKEEKPVSEFYIKASGRAFSRCKDCQKKARRLRK